MQENQVRVGMTVYDRVRKVRGVITSKDSIMMALGCSRTYAPFVNLVVLNGNDKIEKNTMLKRVPIDAVDVCCEELFPIGTTVCSTLGRGFEGTVTGYEYDTNRIVCKSLKSREHSRSRYSYGINELMHYKDKKFVFSLYNRYLINEETIVRVQECSQYKDSLLLVKEKDNTVSIVPKDGVQIQHLELMGFKDVQEVR